MTKESRGKLILPALRGIMGDRVYYSTLMSFKDIACRVSYADEVHAHNSLSHMIQRQIEGRRSREIAEYLENQPERFFNSLVVATYRGDPNWHSLSNLRNKNTNESLDDITDETVESVGFLTLDGNEKLFAVDGQHRLAGIKQFMKNRPKDEHSDEVSVIFVAHEESSDGLQRTRRLFTTLNKTARPVSKGGIIALDEDDVMAICARRLVEETQFFKGDKIAFVAGNNLPVRNTTSLTTIGNLYDVLGILFSKADTDLKKKRVELKRIRPSDEKLEQYFQLATDFFREMADNFAELREFFEAENPEIIVKRYRGTAYDSAMFRPIGLDIFAQIVAKLTTQPGINVPEAIRLSAKLPRTLSDMPYEGLMWDANTKRVTNANRVTLREILLYMLGVTTNISKIDLLERYRRDTGDGSRELPPKVDIARNTPK